MLPSPCRRALPAPTRRRAASPSPFVSEAVLVLVLAPVLALGAAGCGDARAGAEDVEVVDSAGVEIVRNAASGHALDLDMTPELTLGGKDTDVESFYRVSRFSVATDGAGRIAVLDRDGHRVLVFDDTGRHLRTLGGQGDGPGELGWPMSVSTTEDGRIFVFDFGKRGLVMWGPDGEPVDGPGLPDGMRGGHVTTDGEAYLLSVDRAEPFEQQLVRFVPGADTAVIARVPRPEAKPIRLSSCGMGFSGMPPLFSPGLRWAAGGGLVAVVTGSDYVVDLYRDGRLVRSVRRAVDPRPATDALALAEVGDAMRVGTPSGERVCEAAEVAEKRGFADVVPAVQALALGPDGSLWVQRWAVGDEPMVVDLFDPEGRYQGTLPAGTALPVGFLPDGRVLVSETDELDVERLVVTNMSAPWI